MRVETLVAVVLMLSHVAASAQIEPGPKPEPPRFNKIETRMIDRNELLRSIVAQDPWLVRQILDLVEGRNVKSDAPRSLEGIERAKNPDIASAARTAAGSVELFDLLRRARSEKEAGRKGVKADGTERSAAGTVETIEMLRRAQGAKGVRK